MDAVVWALQECERSSHVNIADRGSKGVVSLAPKVLGCSRKSLSKCLIMIMRITLQASRLCPDGVSRNC